MMMINKAEATNEAKRLQRRYLDDRMVVGPLFADHDRQEVTFHLNPTSVNPQVIGVRYCTPRKYKPGTIGTTSRGGADRFYRVVRYDENSYILSPLNTGAAGISYFDDFKPLIQTEEGVLDEI